MKKIITIIALCSITSATQTKYSDLRGHGLPNNKTRISFNKGKKTTSSKKLSQAQGPMKDTFVHTTPLDEVLKNAMPNNQRLILKKANFILKQKKGNQSPAMFSENSKEQVGVFSGYEIQQAIYYINNALKNPLYNKDRKTLEKALDVLEKQLSNTNSNRI